MMHFVCKGAAFVGFSKLCDGWGQQEKPLFAAEDHRKFLNHMAQQSLNFGTKAEYEFRMEIFMKKDAEINQSNSEQDSYELGHNMFSTMTDDEAD